MLPPSVPWAAVHFVGGAGFGVAPQITYDYLLSSLCRRIGVAVIATPYDLGTDHWSISSKVFSSFDTALEGLKERGAIGQNAPTYRIGHSLGALIGRYLVERAS